MNKLIKCIYLLTLFLSLTACKCYNDNMYYNIFYKILNVEQVLASDTIKINDGFSPIPQEIFKIVSFTIHDSIVKLNSLDYLEFKCNSNALLNHYISYRDDSLMLYCQGREQVLLLLNPKLHEDWHVINTNFIPNSRLSLLNTEWSSKIQDTIYVFAVNEDLPHVSDVPTLTNIYFSKSYGFLKFTYKIPFLNNQILDCYNRKIKF